MVNRYDLHHCVDDGDYVLYNDYAALEARMTGIISCVQLDLEGELNKRLALDARIAELEKDAARYRWIKSCQGGYDSQASVTWNMGFDWVVVAGEVLESSIDDAMSREA